MALILISSRLPTPVARVQSRIILCGIWGGQSSVGIRFLPAFLFPLPILIAPTFPYSLLILLSSPHRLNNTRVVR
jgi:hypothetical protein